MHRDILHIRHFHIPSFLFIILVIFFSLPSWSISLRCALFLVLSLLPPFPTQLPVHHLLLRVRHLLQLLIHLVLGISARVNRVEISLRDSIHHSLLARTLATTGHKCSPRTSPTCSWMATTSARGKPAVDVIWRPLWVHGNSDGRIGAVAAQVMRAALNATPTNCGFAVRRRSVTNLD